MKFNNLPNEIFYNIYEFLMNEEIFKINLLNKKHNSLIQENHFKLFLLRRKHPLVFNILHNLCGICNLSIVLNSKTQFEFCSHYHSIKHNR